MTGGLKTAAPPRLQSGMAVDDNSAGSKPGKSYNANGIRPKNSTHLRREYSILAPEVPELPEGGPANTGSQARGDVHGSTKGTADKGWLETETWDETGQRAIQPRVM